MQAIAAESLHQGEGDNEKNHVYRQHNPLRERGVAIAFHKPK
jgi:hypothetical protein